MGVLASALFIRRTIETKCRGRFRRFDRRARPELVHCVPVPIIAGKSREQEMDDALELVKLTGRFSHAYVRWLRARMEQGVARTDDYR